MADQRNMLWLAVALCSLAAPFALAKDCPGFLAAFKSEYCCKDKSLGCFSNKNPYNIVPKPCCYDEDDVMFALYTRDNKEDHVEITRDQSLPSEFSSSRKTVFVIHGWTQGYDIELYQDMKNELLKKDDLNVVVLDWAPARNPNYPQPASDVRTVGKLTSLIMKKMVEDGDASYKDIWCVGHSLGSHVCGNAGRNTPEKIRRITGLDAAGPLFEQMTDITVGLNFGDADLVDVIHTDSKDLVAGGALRLGSIRALGHMDFYVNGRELQPQCKTRRRKRGAIDCSHSRSIVYFTESINNDCFISRQKCSDVNDFPGSCESCDGAEDGVCAKMGYSAEGSGEKGIYYLNTATEDFPPHCLG